MLWFYNIGISLYAFGIRIASLFNPKAKLWIKGRKNIFDQLAAIDFSEATVVWIHAASLGEFEQGRPIIEQIKTDYPASKILLTFFSPSGYEIRKNYDLADWVFYLPIDSKKNAQRFLNRINPTLAIFIKYELWYHFLYELQQAKIPTLLVSALFRKDQFFFKSYANGFKKVIQGLDHIFVQNKHSKNILLEQGITKVTVSGDNRVDRVLKIAAEKQSFPSIEQFTKGSPVMVCGSTWASDEEILSYYINKHPKKWKYIIAPHDISSSRISYIENLFQVKSVRFSEADKNKLQDYDLLIIDNIGMLSSIYQYGKIAYIGGAFGKGLHNTLEPIAFGLPVIFGPNYQKFEEAVSLVEQEGGFSIQSAPAFEAVVDKLEKDTFYQSASNKARDYIENNKGATQEVLNYIKINKLI